jgi:hypothetical protein
MAPKAPKTPKAPKAPKTPNGKDPLFASKHSKAELVQFYNLAQEALENVNAEKRELELDAGEAQEEIRIAQETITKLKEKNTRVLQTTKDRLEAASAGQDSANSEALQGRIMELQEDLGRARTEISELKAAAREGSVAPRFDRVLSGRIIKGSTVKTISGHRKAVEKSMLGSVPALHTACLRCIKRISYYFRDTEAGTKKGAGAWARCERPSNARACNYCSSQKSSCVAGTEVSPFSGLPTDLHRC